MIKVCKFGGTSVADGITMQRVKRILEADPARRYVVVSAPGKRYGGDIKVTDLLYETAREVKEGGHVGDAYAHVGNRFRSVVKELGLDFDIDALLESTAREIEAEPTEDFCASRGEYLSGRIMAAFMGIPFVDAKDVVKFKDGRLDGERSYALVREALKDKPRAVIAGYYGEDEKGHVKTFSRGGSDISGAVVARAIAADEYENWTDVSGFLACDPRIVAGPVGIELLSFQELRQLSYMGANVLHSDSIFPVREANIPIRIRNTFRPEDEGTEILPAERCRPSERAVTGIAGRKDFTLISIDISQVAEMRSAMLRVLEILARYGVEVEHIPAGIDTMSVVVDSEGLKNGVLERLCEEIRTKVCPEKLTALSGVALLAIVGRKTKEEVGVAARLLEALARVGVNVRFIEQNASEANLVVGLDNEQFERSVKAVYEEFFGKEVQPK